jgi:hypothetical protein
METAEKKEITAQTAVNLAAVLPPVKDLTAPTTDTPTVPPTAPTAPYNIQTDAPAWKLDENTLAWLGGSMLDPDKEYKVRPHWAMMGDRKCFPKNELITFNAKPKEGKSTAIYALLKALLSGLPFDTITPIGEAPNMCILFDTEQSEGGIVLRLREMHALLGEDARKFVMVSLLEQTEEERIETIERYVEYFNPDIVVIDGAADLAHNFNNEDESIRLAAWFRRLSAKRTVFTVMHQNKAKDDNNMKGHLGGMLNQKMAENYTVNCEGVLFRVKLVKAKYTPWYNAVGYSFAIDSNENIISPESVIEEHNEKKRQEWISNFAEIFGEAKQLRRTEIKNRIMAKEGIGDSAAEKKITTAKKYGAIYQDEDKNYYLTQ